MLIISVTIIRNQRLHIFQTIGQHVHKNTAISTYQLAAKVQNTHNIFISYAFIWKHMKKKGYESSVSLATLMFINQHIEMQKAWAQAHLNDNWGQIIFTDETAFDLFQNKISWWHKNGKRPIQRLLKSHQKVMVWEKISKKEKTPLFYFTNIIDKSFYMSILQNQLLPTIRNMYRRNWCLQ